MNQVFNPPPAWQYPPSGSNGGPVVPASAEVPSGWQLYPTADSAYFANSSNATNKQGQQINILPPELIPATAPITKRDTNYPLLPVLPGDLTQNPQAKTKSQESLTALQSSKGLRVKFSTFATWWECQFNLIGTILGFLAVLATIGLFIWLYNFALTSLPQPEPIVVGNASFELHFTPYSLEL